MDMVFVKWSNVIFTTSKTDKWLVSKLFKNSYKYKHIISNREVNNLQNKKSKMWK